MMKAVKLAIKYTHFWASGLGFATIVAIFWRWGFHPATVVAAGVIGIDSVVVLLTTRLELVD